MTDQSKPAYTGWAIVEQMGFKVRVGKVSEVEMYGAKLLRLDLPVFDPNHVPSEGEVPRIVDWVTEFAGGSSIYAVTPVAEDVGIDMARDRGDPRPVKPRAYRPPATPALAAPAATRAAAEAEEDDEQF